MAISSNLGFPRIGKNRELKFALEKYWSKQISESELLAIANEVRKSNWELQSHAGIQSVPVNDFSLYDLMLDMSVMLGAIPKRFGKPNNSLAQYFAMARGQVETKEHPGIVAMEMTKWFDTNYHYIVPEFEEEMSFKLNPEKILESVREAKKLSLDPKPVIVGPVSFLMLGKCEDHTKNPLELWEQVLPVYEELFKMLCQEGVSWVQVEEPCLVQDLSEDVMPIVHRVYNRFAKTCPEIKIMLTTYFESLGHELSEILKLPVAGLHLDLARAPEQLGDALTKISGSMILSLGLVDGRNIWKCDLSKTLALAESVVEKIGRERLFIAPSCSLLHVPYDLELENNIDPEMKSWMSFAVQKLHEVALITKGLNEGRDSLIQELNCNMNAVENRKTSARIHNERVMDRLHSVTPEMLNRTSDFKDRKVAQRNLALPLLPTTTVGSFPQTPEIRNSRSLFKQGKLSSVEYDKFIAAEIEKIIRIQEELGLDVLVHGEPERNDMVEFFGEKLSGIVITQFGWVQSYGSRCVKPPIIYGDVMRHAPMTIGWLTYAQSLTHKPVKGMLTGPVTILQWSFVRDDQNREFTCKQIALAIRDEVSDLEKAGISIIQIDEPAVREGLPLRKSEHIAYLRWAVDCFRLASASVLDQTQIHTHMCYCEFSDILSQISAMDADVISIETSRSHMELLDVFAKSSYPNDVGPGVYDIHSPRIPEATEITLLLRKALSVIDAKKLWINPDCGLKTRTWEEVIPALRVMVNAAKEIRKDLKNSTEASGEIRNI